MKQRYKVPLIRILRNLSDHANASNTTRKGECCRTKNILLNSNFKQTISYSLQITRNCLTTRQLTLILPQ